MFKQAEARHIVTLLYNAVFGGEPDPKALEQYVEGLITERCTIAQIIREFAESPEYAQKKRFLRPKPKQFRSFPEAEVFVSPEVVDRLFDKTSSSWRNAASEPGGMYWSVLNP